MINLKVSVAVFIRILFFGFFGICMVHALGPFFFQQSQASANFGRGYPYFFIFLLWAPVAVVMSVVFLISNKSHIELSTVSVGSLLGGAGFFAGVVFSAGIGVPKAVFLVPPIFFAVALSATCAVGRLLGKGGQNNNNSRDRSKHS